MKQPNDTYIGTANDVVGDAIGKIAGNAMHLVYTLRIPYKNSTLDVTMDDWMFLVTPNKLINKTIMKKFGITVGEILLIIERKTQTTEQ